MGASKSGADTLLRQWHMLRAIPRYPAKITAGVLREKLERDGFAVTKRTVERDLHELSEPFPLDLDDRERPYGWRWAKDAPAFDVPNLTNQQALTFALVECPDLIKALFKGDVVTVVSKAQGVKQVRNGKKEGWHTHFLGIIGNGGSQMGFTAAIPAHKQQPAVELACEMLGLIKGAFQ